MFGLISLLKTTRQDNNWFYFLISGILFGLAFHCRFQMSFMIAGLLAWLLFVNKTSVKLIVVLVFGISLALVFGLLADNWLYGHYTLSWWNYLDLNLFQNKASQFGEQPFYFYLEQSFLQLIPPFSLVIIFCIAAFWVKFKRHLFTWITIPFIFLHFFVAHKELRFLFPVLNFLPFMILLYFQSIKDSTHPFIVFFKRRAWLTFAVVVNIGALCAFTFMPADTISFSFKKIYDLVEGENPVLYYSGTNPYNNAAALNYFRNPAIQTVSLEADSLATNRNDVYYISDKFNDGKSVVKNNKKFQRIYSNFPDWFSYLNFNGWLDRSLSFSIYRLESK
jgi:phosphatidylinositol glycan class B